MKIIHHIPICVKGVTTLISTVFSNNKKNSKPSEDTASRS